MVITIWNRASGAWELRPRTAEPAALARVGIASRRLWCGLTRISTTRPLDSGGLGHHGERRAHVEICLRRFTVLACRVACLLQLCRCYCASYEPSLRIARDRAFAAG